MNRSSAVRRVALLRLGQVAASLAVLSVSHPARSQTALTAAQAAGLAAATAQAGQRIIERDRLGKLRPASEMPQLGQVPNATGGPAEDRRQFILTDVRVEGASVLTARAIETSWTAHRGQSVTVADINAIADRIGLAYADRGIALYQVKVPQQDFAGGVAVIRVTEGFVENVTIDGDTKDATLSLVQDYAAHIVADRPLRQATLERYVLLMNDIAGLTVGSRFENAGGRPGAVRLALVVSRKRFEYGVGVTNQGLAQLSNTSLDANVAVNSVFREGDRTQLVFGAPVSFGRYQFYGIVHREPIGSDGATIVATAGTLITPADGRTISGNALTAGVRLNYPVIRAVKESLVASAGLDLLNSTNAAFGTNLSDERTRALRASAFYGLQDGWDGITTAGITFSLGVNWLAARRGNAASGEPSFSKITAAVSRQQTLPLDFILRLSAAGQWSPVHLPLSEQFSYGGSMFGRSFQAGAVLGDRGFELAAELAYPLAASWALPHTSGYEVFTYTDYGQVYAINTPYQYAQDHGSSAGFGARAMLLDKVTLDLTAARTLQQPKQVSGTAGWRLVVGLRGTF